MPATATATATATVSVDAQPLRPLAERATGAPTVGRMLLLAAERAADVALRYPRGGRTETITYAQMADRCRAIALTIDELLSRGVEVDAHSVDGRIEAVAPEDLATIVYTSGTTGPPKGCALSHANFIAASTMSRGLLRLEQIQPVVYQFLPLAHVFARVIQTVVLDVGGTLVFWSDSKRIVTDLAEARPTHIVPLSWIWT